MTEVAIFEMAFRDSQARSQAAGMRTEIDALGRSAQGHVAKVGSATGTNSRFAGSLKDVEPKLGKVATGVSGVAGAMGGLLGQTNAVVGATANLAAAFVGAGGIGLAVVGVATAVGALAGRWSKVREEAKAAAEAQAAAVEDAAGAASAMAKAAEARLIGSTSDELRASIQETESAIAELEAQVQSVDAAMMIRLDHTISVRDADAAAAEQVIRLRGDIANLQVIRAAEAEALARTEAAETELTRRKEEEAEENRRLKETLDAATTARRGHSEAIQEELTFSEQLKAARSIGAGLDDPIVARAKAQQDAIAEIDEFERGLYQVSASERQDNFVAEQEWKERRLQEAAEAEKARIAEVTSVSMQATRAAVDVSTGLYQSFLTMAANEEDKILEKLLVQALAATGSRLVALGTEWGFKGAAYLIESSGADPRGYALLGIGGAAVATGVGLGGASLGAAKAFGLTGGAGAGGGASDLAIGRSSGSPFRGRGSGGGGSGGAMEVHEHYHFGAAVVTPVASARALTRLESQRRRTQLRPGVFNG